MDYAGDIKRAVTMREAAEVYGLHVNRNGYTCCPFHHEKTPSMKIYKGNGGWHCFGCGKGGDVISFVQEFFGLSFQEACSKLNDDFHLGLPIGKKLSDRERLEANRKAYERRRVMKAHRKAEEAAKSAHSDALAYYVAVSTIAERLRPKWPDFRLWDGWVEALHELPKAEYELEQAETRLYEVEHERSCKPS